MKRRCQRNALVVLILISKDPQPPPPPDVGIRRTAFSPPYWLTICVRLNMVTLFLIASRCVDSMFPPEELDTSLVLDAVLPLLLVLALILS